MKVPGSNPGRGCAYTVLQTFQICGVYSVGYGALHYKEPLKSFEIRVGNSPGFGLPSVAILPKCAESDVKQYTLKSLSIAQKTKGQNVCLVI